MLTAPFGGATRLPLHKQVRVLGYGLYDLPFQSVCNPNIKTPEGKRNKDRANRLRKCQQSLQRISCKTLHIIRYWHRPVLPMSRRMHPREFS
jgi:hypothetical protein